MADRSERKGLGRGLSALLADNPDSTSDDVVSQANSELAIDKIVPNPDQPRKTFKKEELDELADSIRTNGILQPIVVRPSPEQSGSYQIVVGERRWRAAQLAQLHDIPAIVRELDDASVMELAIIENIQRSDLNAIEEALGYRQLMDKFGHTQEKLGSALGKSRSHIANLLRLLNLPADVQEMVASGQLSAGHARILVPLENASELASQIIKGGLSVREAERLAKGPTKNPSDSANLSPKKDADTRAIEAELSATLKMRVSISPKDDGSGELKIGYKSLDQLDSLLSTLAG